MKLYSIKSAADQIRKSLIEIEPFGGTRYFTLELDDEEIKIRISDHSARAANNNGNKTFSFVTNKNIQDCNMQNEWVVDFEGEFEDEFTSLEDCLEWELN